MKYQIFITLLLITQSLAVLGQTNWTAKQPYIEIDSLFNAHYKSNTTGAALAIIKNGETRYKNTNGLANIEYDLPITDSSVFHIASISKQFTTYLALLLAEEGKLSLNDDIKIYLPEFKHLPNRITVKDLMTHTHGLPNAHELAHLKGILPQGEMTHQQIVKMLLNVKQTNFAVGDKYEYNNTGYILLAEIIARVGEKPFKEQLKQRIFLPLGMNHTQAIDDINIIVQNKAYSYQLVNNEYKNYPLKLSAIGASGINTTINDMVLWAKNYQNPIVGSQLFFNKMEQAIQLNSGKKIDYGLGLQFGTYKGIDIVFHGGGDVGYRSYILHAPKHELSIVILANTNDFSAFDVAYQAIEILLKNHIKTARPTQIKRNNKQLKKYEGTYEFQPGVYFNIIAEKDTLYFQSYGTKNKIALPYLGGNTFNFPGIPHSKFVFYQKKFDFQIADFTYECFKTTIQAPNPNEITLVGFTGIFRNKEHKITYDLTVIDNKLTIQRVLGDDIILSPLTPKSFYSPVFGKLDFIYGANGQVNGFRFSGQNLKHIVFEN